MKTCIIGTGAISGIHLDALKKINAEIVGLCDIDERKASKKAAEFSLCCPVFTDYKKMFDAVCPDVVHICTPHYLHAEMVICALEKNINVLSEKPVCINFKQLSALKAAREKSSAHYGVCFQNRYLAANREANREVKNAKIFGASGAVVWNRGADYYASGAWRGKWKTEGGGVLINQSIHTLDLMIDALGMPVSIKAEMKNEHLQGIIEVEDFAFLSLKYPDFTATFTATTGGRGSYPVTTSFYTDAGIVQTRGDVLVVNGKETDASKEARLSGKTEWGAGHEMLIADFYDAVKENRPVSCDFLGCLDTMKTVLAAYESAKTGKEIFTENIKL